MSIRNAIPEELRRLESKTLDAQFKTAVQEGLNCSPFESEAVLGVVRKIYLPFWEPTAKAFPPGRISLVAICADEPAGITDSDRPTNGSDARIGKRLNHLPNRIGFDRAVGVDDKDKITCRFCHGKVHATALSATILLSQQARPASSYIRRDPCPLVAVIVPPKEWDKKPLASTVPARCDTLPITGVRKQRSDV